MRFHKLPSASAASARAGLAGICLSFELLQLRVSFASENGQPPWTQRGTAIWTGNNVNLTCPGAPKSRKYIATGNVSDSRACFIQDGHRFQRRDFIMDHATVLIYDPCPLGLPQILTVAHGAQM